MKKLRIVIVVIAFMIASFGAYKLVYDTGTSAKRLPDKYNGTIARVTSSHDTDGDGIDDQSDILEGTLAYLETRPKYKSQYYDGGYPNDGYGVCTDVVAQGFFAAGFDLMRLVDKDIKAYPDDYDVDKPDANIDFRRVKNLNVFFMHTCVSLTTDVKDIEEWQGGDVVVMKKHIGIVSDRRNKNGVPYILHHTSPRQKRYEMDILEKRKDIIGHYRVP